MNHDNEATLPFPSSSEDPVLPPFTVGQWVSVASRTSPGINQPGGIGRITALNEKDRTVSVKYVLDGRHEKNVHLQFVQMYSWEETSATANTSIAMGNTRLRDRTMLLGRCTYCGSLRADCQSCDFATATSWNHHSFHNSTRSEPPRRRRGSNLATSALVQPNAGNDSDTTNSASDSSNDSAHERMMQRHRREFVRYKRSMRRAAAWSLDGERLDIREHEPFLKQAESPSSASKHRLQKKNRKRDYDRLQNETSILATVGAASESGSDHNYGTEDHPMLALASNSDSDSDHSLDHLPLQQLAARALQGPMTQHHPSSFIQPEGDAEQLPQDVPDLTGAVTYPQLLPLLDELLHRMETVDIPQAKRELLQFERALQEAQKDPLVMRAQSRTLQQQR
jgi:hypothetical protein